MERITIEQLQVRSRFILSSIKDCYIKASFGGHIQARIVAEVKAEQAGMVLTKVDEDKVEIVSVSREEGGGISQKLIFSGMVHKIRLQEEGKYTLLTLEAVSSSWRMDIRKKSRSFQNIKRSYQQVVEMVLSDYGATLSGEIADRKLEYPLIQYRETDFVFLKRIFSHLGEGIGIHYLSSGISLFSGNYVGRNQGEIRLDECVHMQLPFYTSKGDLTAIGYVLEDMDIASIGDAVTIEGKEYRIKDMEAGFVGNLLSCRWKVFPKSCFKVEKQPAITLKDAVLIGEVLQTGQEKVRLHLQMDEEQSKEEAYDFPWLPITGNLLYCMPEVGTKVALRFAEGKEEKPMVVYNLRENGETCKELGDCNSRYLTTAGQKRMYAKPEEMGLINLKEKNAKMALKDGNSLTIKTKNKLSILAKGQVELKGKQVSLTTPQEATLVRKDMLSPTVINLCNAFDAIGKTGNFAAAPKSIEKKRKRTMPGSGQQEPYSMEDVIEHIFANIPSEVEDNPALEAIAGGMPIVTRLKR